MKKMYFVAIVASYFFIASCGPETIDVGVIKLGGPESHVSIGFDSLWTFIQKNGDTTSIKNCWDMPVLEKEFGFRDSTTGAAWTLTGIEDFPIKGKLGHPGYIRVKRVSGPVTNGYRVLKSDSSMISQPVAMYMRTNWNTDFSKIK